MASVARANPGSITSAFITSTTIGATGNSLYLAVQSHDMDLHTRLADATGDTDEQPFLQSNRLVYGTISLTGFALADNAIGIDELRDGDTYTLTLNYSSSRTTTWKVMLERIRVSCRRDDPVAGVSIQFRLHGNTNAEVDSAEA